MQFSPPNLFVYPGDNIKCYLEIVDYGYANLISLNWEYVFGYNNDLSISNMVMKDDILYILRRARPSYHNLVKCVVRDSSGNIKIQEIRNYTIVCKYIGLLLK